MNVKEAALICVICGIGICILISGYFGVLMLEQSPIETITIGEFGGTIITRTQTEGCDGNFGCIDKEIYTGTVTEVESNKLIFEDGYILHAIRIDGFNYKLGCEHVIEVDIYGASRIVKEVTILN